MSCLLRKEMLKQPASPLPESDRSGILDPYSAGRLFAALAPSNIGIAILDKSFRWRAINGALAQTNGFPVEAHIGKSIYELLPSISGILGPLYERVLSTSQPIYGFQISAKLLGGADIGHWTLDCLPIKGDKGTASQVCAIVVEVMREIHQEPLLNDHRIVLRKLAIRILREQTLAKSVAEIEFGEDRHQEHASNQEDSDSLSRREREVLRFLAEGNANKEVAAILGISVKTVETYRTRVLHKLSLDSLVGLVHYAIRHQIVKA